jgi:hypothetical protein
VWPHGDDKRREKAITATEIHIHVPAHLEGPVHVYVHGAEVETSSLPAEGNGVDATTSADAEQILVRFEKHDPVTAARKVHEHLVGAGWQPVVPAKRGGAGKSPAAYLRYIYQGNKERAVLYLNTKALVSTGAKERTIVSSLGDAELHNGTDTYLYHDNGRLQQALAAVKVIQLWADGEDIDS